MHTCSADARVGREVSQLPQPHIRTDPQLWLPEQGKEQNNRSYEPGNLNWAIQKPQMGNMHHDVVGKFACTACREAGREQRPVFSRIYPTMPPTARGSMRKGTSRDLDSHQDRAMPYTPRKEAEARG